MIDQLRSHEEGKQRFHRSVTKFRGVARPGVSMYVKAMIVIVGALMALAI